ncbi:unknown [Parabacteroides sp. CAG:409]|nr:unknown [Parabacteroides sp. CAG:409]
MIYRQLNLLSLSGCLDFIFRPFFSIFISNNFHTSRLIYDTVPYQSEILAFFFRFTSITFAVDKQFGFRSGGINMYRNNLSFTTSPVPMRQNMCHREIRTPMRLIQIITVFRESGQIDNTEITTPRRRLRTCQFCQLFFQFGSFRRISPEVQQVGIV